MRMQRKSDFRRANWAYALQMSVFLVRRLPNCAPCDRARAQCGLRADKRPEINTRRPGAKNVELLKLASFDGSTRMGMCKRLRVDCTFERALLRHHLALLSFVEQTGWTRAFFFPQMIIYVMTDASRAEGASGNEITDSIANILANRVQQQRLMCSAQIANRCELHLIQFSSLFYHFHSEWECEKELYGKLLFSPHKAKATIIATREFLIKRREQRKRNRVETLELNC